MFRWCIPSLLISCVLCTPEIQQLPHCQDDTEAKNERSVLFVSTLDGKLTALDLSRDGKKKWTLNFLDKPLLSSNIDKGDLNINRQWTRMIPSLKGNLYKFDGENLEPIPVTVDQLSRSSFRYEDLMIDGDIQTKTYEISSSSGKIIRECEMNQQCNNTVERSNTTEDTLIVKYRQYTVRATELSTRSERWNFSVGEHNLTILSPKNLNCHKKIQPTDVKIDIRAIISEGLVVAYSKNTKLWEYKFDSPLVSVWREDQVQEDVITPLTEENIFNISPLNTELESELTTSPGIYIGMHKRQLYIQENPFFSKTVDYSITSEQPKYPWIPHSAIEFSEESENTEYKDISREISDPTDPHTATALLVLSNSEYINGRGFYVYSKEQVEQEKEKQCNGTGPKHTSKNKSQSETEDGNETTNIVFIYSESIWYWWREITIISITTAILFHCTATKFWRDKTKDAMPLPVIVERGVEEKNLNDSGGENFKIQVDESHSEIQPPNFHSHYEENFKPLELLGSGAYGIVFKAQNKTDESIYALKRINLPSNEKSRKRMMREAYVLAKLQHPHIVRYYYAWTECPPTGWQEEHDSRFNNDSKYPQTDFDETSANETSVHIDVPSDPPSVDQARDALDQTRNDDYSYIQFEVSPESSAYKKLEENEDSSSSDDEDCNDNCINDTDQSIVFEDSHNSISDRKSQLELNLRKRKNSNKSNPKVFLYIQMELCREKNLKEWLDECKCREKDRILNIFSNIVEAVEYVHKENMIHRDLKTSNIFFTLSKDMRIVIGDFGLVTGTSENFSNKTFTPTAEEGCTSKNLHTAKVGTYFYMAPELMNGKNYDYKVDIYSLGIILFELLMPFGSESERIHKLQNLRNSIFPDDFSTMYSEEFKLLNMMLHENPKERPTATEIKLQLPSLRKVNRIIGAGDQTDNPSVSDQSDTVTKEISDFFGFHFLENFCT